MLRFMIEPASREYYAQQDISFGFHQLLRVLDDPVSMIDPTGFLSERDTIIGHLLQVTHLNPIYDLQLLQCFDDGLDELERQVQQMLDGTHPRRRTIGAIVEDAGLPPPAARLRARLPRRSRSPRSRRCASRRCAAIRTSPRPSAASRRCPGYLCYCARLPRRLGALWRRARALERFPLDQAEAGPSRSPVSASSIDSSSAASS